MTTVARVLQEERTRAVRGRLPEATSDLVRGPVGTNTDDAVRRDRVLHHRADVRVGCPPGADAPTRRGGAVQTRRVDGTAGSR